MAPRDEGPRIPEGIDSADRLVDGAVSKGTSERWTRADLDRLIAGDDKTWNRAGVLIVGAVEASRVAYTLTTLEVDAVRDHIEDILLAEGRRRLREVHDPGMFAAYLKAVAQNRARYLAKHRVKVLPLSEMAAEALAAARPPNASSPVAAAAEGAGIMLARTLLRFRGALKEQQFRTLWLGSIEGMSMCRIANAMKISREAVRQARKRAVCAIRAAVARSRRSRAR